MSIEMSHGTFLAFQPYLTLSLILFVVGVAIPLVLLMGIKWCEYRLFAQEVRRQRMQEQQMQQREAEEAVLNPLPPSFRNRRFV